MPSTLFVPKPVTGSHEKFANGSPHRVSLPVMHDRWIRTEGICARKGTLYTGQTCFYMWSQCCSCSVWNELTIDLQRLSILKVNMGTCHGPLHATLSHTPASVIFPCAHGNFIPLTTSMVVLLAVCAFRWLQTELPQRIAPTEPTHYSMCLGNLQDAQISMECRSQYSTRGPTLSLDRFYCRRTTLAWPPQCGDTSHNALQAYHLMNTSPSSHARQCRSWKTLCRHIHDATSQFDTIPKRKVVMSSMHSSHLQTLPTMPNFVYREGLLRSRFPVSLGRRYGRQCWRDLLVPPTLAAPSTVRLLPGH